MSVSGGLLLLPLLLLAVPAGAGKKAYSAIVDLEKGVATSKLSSKDFHEYNLGRVLFNYAAGVTKEDLARVKSFNDLQYTGKITVGFNDQPMNVIFDPALADVLLLSSEHDQCKGMFGSLCRHHATYNEQKSFVGEFVRIPWESEKMEPTFDLFRESSGIQGHLEFDRIKIGKLVVPQAHSLIGAITQGYIYGRADGVVGVGRMEDSYFSRGSVIKTDSEIDRMSIKIQPTFVEALKRQGASKIGFFLYKSKKSGTEVGKLFIGDEKESSKYRGQIVWIPQPQFKGAYWRITVSEIRILRKPDEGSKKGTVDPVALNALETLAIPDPGTSLIAGPQELIDIINQKLFKGMELFKSGDVLGTVEFECKYTEQLPSVAFVISGKEYTLEPKNYVRKLTPNCATGFMAVAKLQSLVLGDPFFQKYFVVFDNVSKQIGLAESK